MASTRHPRSRTGCWICRLRKKKCDETKPTCQQCQNLKIQCDGYGTSQPTWMRDPVAGKRKKDEIKLQIGKRGRRRRKNRPGKDLEAAKSVEGEILLQQGDNGESKVILEDDTTTKTPGLLDAGGEKIGETQHFVFETIEGGIRLLKPFNETPGKSSSQAVTMLDSPCPPVGCFRCPVKNPFSTIARRGSGYSLPDTHTGKPLLQSIRSEVVVVATPPLQKPIKSTNPNTRTKEEEIDYDEYDVIITTFTSLSKRQTPFGLSDIPDPSLIPPVNLHELDLVKNYIRNVFRLTFSGMSETRIHKTLREVVVPLLCTNPGFVKGCMSSSAMHLAISNGESGPNFKDLLKDSWEHGIECVHGLRKMLEDGGASEQTLALILVLVSFEVPSPLSNWQLHLQAAIECLVHMDLLNRPTHTAITKFLMSRIIWLDILSALTLGRAPQLWANYREILSRPVHQRSCCGLLDMMGCDDTVMFLVSEVMCVEDYKFRTLDDGMISWTRGRKRAMELDIRLRDRDLPVAVKLPPSPEPPSLQLPPPDEDSDSTNGDDDDANSYLVSPSPSPAISDSQSPVPSEENHSNLHNASPIPSSPAPTVAPLSPPTTSEGPVSKEKTTLNDADYHNDHSIPPELHPDEDMIVKATTAAFRTATRIHLWSIGLGFYPHLSFFQQLLEELTVMIALIPIELSRVVAWPLLVGGCTAIKPKDREYFARRCTIGDGTLCGIAKIMREVWKRSDESDRSLGVGCGQEVHWRSIMREQGMEILLV